MYEKLKDLFVNGKLSEVGLNRAVAKGWITEAELATIKTSRNSEEKNGQA